MNYPLLCFLSHQKEASITGILHFTSIPLEHPVHINGVPVKKWVLNDRVFYSSVIIVPGAKRGALIKVKQMSQTFWGPVLFFDNFVTDNIIRNAGVSGMERLIFVNAVDSIARGLNIVCTLEQIRLLREELFAPAHAQRTGRRRGRLERDEEDSQAFADRFVENMLQRRRIEPPTHLRDDNLVFQNANVFVTSEATYIVQNDEAAYDEDEAFARAQTLSLMGGGGGGERDEHEENNQLLNQDWKKVLKEHSDPIENDQDPVCVTCSGNKATICFVPCGHLVMCDTCVTQMWSLPQVRKLCPVCNGLPVHICRPISSANSLGK
jgi:hypothetical protein